MTQNYEKGSDSLDDGADLWTYRITERSGHGSVHHGVIEVHGNAKLRDMILFFLQSQEINFKPEDYLTPAEVSA